MELREGKIGRTGTSLLVSIFIPMRIWRGRLATSVMLGKAKETLANFLILLAPAWANLTEFGLGRNSVDIRAALGELCTLSTSVCIRRHRKKQNNTIQPSSR